ncbi:AzlD domain-containing protein [Eubacterium callanderi]|uniref:AzlD domain-containing protein n=1 Tax=Eubacterium callanderi TaxID=53442 RepID=UPI00311935BF
MPFFVFPDGKTPLAYIRYLGSVLFYAILFITVLHKWKKNTLLSIGAGTVIYMFLVQVLF